MRRERQRRALRVLRRQRCAHRLHQRVLPREPYARAKTEPNATATGKVTREKPCQGATKEQTQKVSEKRPYNKDVRKDEDEEGIGYTDEKGLFQTSKDRMFAEERADEPDITRLNERTKARDVLKR